MSLPAFLGAPPQVLSDAYDIAAALDRAIDEHANDPEILTLIRDVAERLRSDLRPIVERLDFVLLQRIGTERELPLPNGWKLERYADMREDYDDDKVLAAYATVLKKHALDVESGELLFRPEHAEQIVSILLPCMTKAKPKKQAMKAHQIDPRELCSLSWGDDKIRVVKPEPTAEVSHPPVTLVRGGGQ